MNGRPTGMRWLLALVLPSALGLLVFGVVGLLGNARQLRQEARDEGRAAAEAEARSLRQAMTDRKFLDRLPEASRFETDEAGQILVPEGLVAINSAKLESPRPAYLSYPVEQALARSAALEFEQRDPAAAIETLESALAAAMDEEDVGALALRLAWCAQRQGDADRRRTALDRLLQLEAPSNADRISGLLLAVASARDFAAPLLDALTGIAEPEALLMVDRLRDLAPERSLAIAAELRARISHRRRLAAIQPRLASVRLTDSSALEALDDEILLVFARTPGASRPTAMVGALISPEVAIAAAGLDRGRFAVAAILPEGAIPAIPLVAALPSRFAGETAPTELGFTVLLLGGLFVAFVGGLVLATRALRREAMAAQVRSEFLTSVTHELKTPLASIRLIAEMLEEGLVKDKERRDEYHRLLSSETARLSMLIENVLDLGRMDRGERAYDRRTDQPAEVVAAAVGVFKPIARRDGLEVEASLVAPESSAQLDRGALVQALLNLLENGRKYALEGGRLELSDEVEDAVYRLRLRDHGPGIPADELEAVFDRFKRGRAQADGRIAGVGLGLHLARRIVEDHGGSLVAALPEDGGKGTVFVLELPLDPELGEKS